MSKRAPKFPIDEFLAICEKIDWAVALPKEDENGSIDHIILVSEDAIDSLDEGYEVWTIGTHQRH